MKIFGKHNTKATNGNLTHQVAKMFLDKANGAFCINQKLMDLMGVKKGDEALIVFIEDDNGTIGVARTDDKETGLPLHWYKRDTRGRTFNGTMVEYFVDKFKLDNKSNSYHIVFHQLPKIIKKFTVYQVREIFPYNRAEKNF